MEFLLRSYAPEDADALGQVFFRGVHEGAAAKYSIDQRAAWVPEPPTGEAWESKLANSDCVVALCEGKIVGFMSRQGAYFDMAYVLPEVMGKGVAGVMCAVIEGRARADGITHMTVDASHLAESFFERRGWNLVRRQEVERRGVTLQNCKMEKHLVRGDERLSA
ncbi:MAG: GNAT family N-acetyltransferase [Paracoccaceae bacterium]